MLEAGLPPRALFAVDGQRGGDWRHAGRRIRRRDSFRSPDRAKSGCISTNWRRKRPRGRSGSSAWSPRWAARTPSSWTAIPISTRRSRRAVYSAFGYQGQKCSACSRAIVDSAVYDEFLDKLKSKVEHSDDGAAGATGELHGPVISARARDTILELHRDRQERRTPDQRRRRGAEARVTSSSRP